MLIVDGARLARGGLGFGQDVVILRGGAVDTFLEDGLRFIELELGLEVVEVVGVATTIGTTTGIDEVEFLVDNFLAHITPGTVRDKTDYKEGMGGEQYAYQLPLPAPFFFVFLGSTPSKPFLAKNLGRLS